MRRIIGRKEDGADLLSMVKREYQNIFFFWKRIMKPYPHLAQ